jgi:DNA-binding transcriptional LysR family regulator
VRIRQLEYFVAICDAGSFTAASAQLFVAQPSLSQQIRQLEAELGGSLFERTAHGVVLTSAGKVFAAASREILNTIDRSVDEFRAVLEGRQGETVILSVRSIIAGILPSAISHLHTEMPDVVYRLRDFNHRNKVEAALARGEGDIAVGPRPRNWLGPIVSLGWEEIVLVGQRAGGNRTGPWNLDELRSAAWILYEADHGFSEVVKEFCGMLGLEPNAVAHCDQVEAALSLAAQGVGVALVPSNVIPAGWTDLISRTEPQMLREVTAYARQPHTLLVDQVLKALGEAPVPLLELSQIPANAVRL